MYGESDFAAAAKHLERAFTLDRANARVLGNSATLLDLLGRRTEALALREAIAILEPVGGTFVEIVADPLFARLYGDPRWIAFLRSIARHRSSSRRSRSR